jgi:hypothetical protein
VIGDDVAKVGCFAAFWDIGGANEVDRFGAGSIFVALSETADFFGAGFFPKMSFRAGDKGRVLGSRAVSVGAGGARKSKTDCMNSVKSAEMGTDGRSHSQRRAWATASVAGAEATSAYWARGPKRSEPLRGRRGAWRRGRRVEVEEEEEANDLAQCAWIWLGGAGAW